MPATLSGFMIHESESHKSSLFHEGCATVEADMISTQIERFGRIRSCFTMVYAEKKISFFLLSKNDEIEILCWKK